MINAMHALDIEALFYQVRLNPHQARKFVGEVGDPWPVGFVSDVNKRMPRTRYGGDNPNNGQHRHNFYIGREYSRVIYVEIIKIYACYYGPADWGKLKTDLRRIANAHQADEFDVVEDSDGVLKIRVWWD